MFWDVVLNTREDIDRWERVVRAEFRSISARRVWLLIDLSGLSVHPRVSSYFGERRALILEEHTLRSFRFGGDTRTKVSISTTSVLHGADANLYASRDEAEAALLKAMREDDAR